ncbi:HMA2 domain-containing protein [Clostridium tyrobutyricum]|uniref:HMA2 domain-containing protein n=2 Tax=Clostridium tyrobutyricum TaxID=1519 RepID=UPI002ED2B207
MDTLKDSVNLAVYDKTNGIFDFKSILTLVLIAVGITTYIKRPESLPNGINYLWWAYSNTI